MHATALMKKVQWTFDSEAENKYNAFFIAFLFLLGEAGQLGDGAVDGLDVGDREGEAFGAFFQSYGVGAGLGIADDMHEVLGLVERVVRVGGEMADHLVLFQYQFLNAEFLGHTSQGDGLDEFLRGFRQRTEAVGKPFAVAVQFLFGAEVVVPSSGA